MQNADLQGIYSELTHKLIKTRFLTTNMDDEKEYLKALNKQVNNDGTWHLTLNPTQNCNFRCWYCYEKHPKGYMQPETVKRIKCLATHILKKEILNISFFLGLVENLYFILKRLSILYQFL